MLVLLIITHVAGYCLVVYAVVLEETPFIIIAITVIIVVIAMVIMIAVTTMLRHIMM